MDTVDCIVVGAGVVGLAVARELALAGHEVVVLEALPQMGSVTSARNSEVIHAGLYYPEGSLKAQLCVRGKALLYEFCATHQVPHRRLGKLIVASAEDEAPALAALQAQGAANGVNDLVWLDAAQAQALEPALTVHAALHSPSTGIIDSHAFMAALWGQAQDHGAMLALASPLLHAQVRADGFVLHVGGEEPMQLHCRWLINSAGLLAPQVAQRIEGLAQQHIPNAFFCKGNYFALSGRAPFSRLVYPMHNSAGLGVHFTLDLGGQGRFGPDVQWIEGDGTAIDYTVDSTRQAAFEAAIRRWWPALPQGALHPAYSGVRPKITGPGTPAADFMPQGPDTHGVPGLVNLFGIESPGLTASLALAQEVRQRLRDPKC